MTPREAHYNSHNKFFPLPEVKGQSATFSRMPGIFPARLLEKCLCNASLLLRDATYRLIAGTSRAFSRASICSARECNRVTS